MKNSNKIYFNHTEMTVNKYNYFCPFSMSISQYLWHMYAVCLGILSLFIFKTSWKMREIGYENVAIYT